MDGLRMEDFAEDGTKRGKSPGSVNTQFKPKVLGDRVDDELTAMEWVLAHRTDETEQHKQYRGWKRLDKKGFMRKLWWLQRRKPKPPKVVGEVEISPTEVVVGSADEGLQRALGLISSLEPGECSERIRSNLQARRLWLEGTQEGLFERCKSDIFFYIDHFVWQYNPLKVDLEPGPFILYDFQRECVDKILWSIAKQKPLVIRKSRDMGASWLCLIIMDYLCKFKKWQTFLMVSRSADAVDAPDDPHCLFWKIIFINQYQPNWLAGGVRKRKMGFRYATGSVITGQASTGDIGIGGRATAIFCDEFARVKEDYKVLHGTAHTANCRIFNSTQTGPETAFAELCERVDIDKLRMLWHQHPDKNAGLYQEKDGKAEILDPSYSYPPDFNFILDGKLRSPWYDAMCVLINDKRAIARDLDDDMYGTEEQFFDVGQIKRHAAEFACDPLWEGGLVYDANSKHPTLKPSYKGPLKLWIALLPDGGVPKGKYKGGVDTSTGMGRTPSCLSILNAATGEKVGEYTHAFLSPDQFAVEVVDMAKLFLDEDGASLELCWERNGPGGSFGKKVLELGYGRIYLEEKKNVVYKELSPGLVYGWQNSPPELEKLLSDYRSALRDGHFLNRSEGALKETLGYKWDIRGHVVCGMELQTNHPSGAKYNHGDRVIADALAWKMSKGLPARPEKPAGVVPCSLAWRAQQHKPVSSGWE